MFKENKKPERREYDFMHTKTHTHTTHTNTHILWHLRFPEGV